ncbi:YezD family protein [Robertmurraya siralis]|uniref:YezD family protein n=1 Tax=Robertmurraya siralis TaxID=77777 RepID=UPI0035715942
MLQLPLKGTLDQKVIEKIVSLLEGLEYGTVQITVHDSEITQIDRLEKYRLPPQGKMRQQPNGKKSKQRY